MLVTISSVETLNGLEAMGFRFIALGLCDCLYFSFIVETFSGLWNCKSVFQAVISGFSEIFIRIDIRVDTFTRPPSTKLMTIKFGKQGNVELTHLRQIKLVLEKAITLRSRDFENPFFRRA